MTEDREFLIGLNVRNCEKLSLNVFGSDVCKLPTSTVNTYTCVIYFKYIYFLYYPTTPPPIGAN